MRILSARILRARRIPATNQVEAVVKLLIEPRDAPPYYAQHLATAQARCPQGPSLRQRLLAAAKLLHFSQIQAEAGRRAA